MNYNDMSFTDNDKKRLIENRDMIVNWIMQNIVPNLDEDAKIIIDFGGIYNCPRTWRSVENYHFGVYGKKREFYLSSNNGSGYIGFGEKFGGINYPFEKVTNPYNIYPIVDNWKMIKTKLLSFVEETKKNKKSIYSFEV